MTTYVSKDMDEELEFTAAKSLNEHPDYCLDTHYPTMYNPHTACRNLGVPFHPGVERYYCSHGYMTYRDVLLQKGWKNSIARRRTENILNTETPDNNKKKGE